MSKLVSIMTNISNFFESIVDYIGNIGNFIRGVLRLIGAFLKLMFTYIFDFVDHIFGLSGMHYFNETLGNISIFTGVDTVYFISMFVVCLMLVLFKFILRLFHGYTQFKNSK